MTTWRARLGVIAVFVVGFLCGGVTVSLVRARAIMQSLNQPDAWTERSVHRLGRQLDLTREQRREVRRILTDARAESGVTLKGVQPEMIRIFDRAQGRIRNVLGPKQVKKYEEISARRRARFIDRFGGGGAPGAAPPP
jgi:Spy/CpxP family protein refolding chaperone